MVVSALSAMSATSQRMRLMMFSRTAAVALLGLLLSSPINAAPLGGLAQEPVATNSSPIVERVHDRPFHSGYTRVCNDGPRGWMLRNHRGQLIACRPHRLNDFGWSWREEGGRSGWYHRQDRVWR
jgi:hypothetical protein